MSLGWAAATGGSVGRAASSAALPAVLRAGAHPAAAQAAVVFLCGDRVPAHAPDATPLVARLQRPAEVAAILAAKFPGASILVAAPPRFNGDFACYDGFLPGSLDAQGVPATFSAAAGCPAAQALSALLAQGGIPSRERALPSLVLVAFSKAAVVLHQLLVELAAWQRAAGTACAACAQLQPEQGQGASEPLPWQATLAAIRHLHFLDAGGNRRGAALPAHPADIAAALARRCPEHAIQLHLHGTPRQWRDPRRPWLAQEAGGLAAACAAAGVRCRRREYFAGQAPSLEQHFAAIQAFEPGA